MVALAPGGYAYAAPLVVAGVVTVLINPLVAVLLFVLAAAVGAFYRDPKRDPPLGGIVAPADGKVQVVRTEADGRVRVGVFMNVWDVHVNRSPFPCRVVDTEHVDGAHRPAFSKESDRNERVHVDCDTPFGDARVTLIAGAFARRIHPYVVPEENLRRGARIGHISFGSRADVILPEQVEKADLDVERGDRVTAGETLLVPNDLLDDELR